MQQIQERTITVLAAFADDGEAGTVAATEIGFETNRNGDNRCLFQPLLGLAVVSVAVVSA
ncbi:MAG: hypothetical protein ACKO2L_01625 [Planctomycetaceae bacterium]